MPEAVKTYWAHATALKSGVRSSAGSSRFAARAYQAGENIGTNPTHWRRTTEAPTAATQLV